MKNNAFKNIKTALAFLAAAVILLSVMTVAALADDQRTASSQAELYSAVTTAPSGATRTVTVTADIEVNDLTQSHEYAVPAGACVVITSADRHIISLNIDSGYDDAALFFAKAIGATVRLTGNLTLDCTGGFKALRGVRACEGGTVVIDGNGVIIQNFGTDGVSNRKISSSAGTINVSGGRVQNCGTLNQGNGGGIEVYGGTASISGCTITGCKAKYGGGIALIGASLSAPLTNVTVDRCEAGSSGMGGGIYIEGNCAVTLGAGTLISNNSSARYGGGVVKASHSSRLTVDGAVICGNTAATFGGGIVVYSKSGAETVFVMNGGTVSGNQAGTNGGGIALISDSRGYAHATFNGGEVAANAAAGDGGGLYATPGTPEINLFGGSISGNEAGGNGSDVILRYNGTYGSTTAKIKGGFSGGIYLENDSCYLVKDGAFEWSDPVVIRVPAGKSIGAALVVSGEGAGKTVESSDAAKFTTYRSGAVITPKYNGGVLEYPPYTYTVKDAETGSAKTKVVESLSPSAGIISLSALTASGDFAQDGARSCFIGFAEVENYGEANARLIALYRAGSGATAEELDGKTLYAAWINMTTYAGASIKLPSGEGSGIRFVTLIDTVTMKKVGLRQIISRAQYEGAGTAGVGIGLSIMKDFDGTSFSNENRYYLDGREDLDASPWYGDALYPGGVSGMHAFSFGLMLSEPQYSYAFTPRAFFGVVYSDGTSAEVAAAYPKDPDDASKPLVRTARQVAVAYTRYLSGMQDPPARFGLTAAQMSKLEAISGFEYTASSGTPGFVRILAPVITAQPANAPSMLGHGAGGASFSVAVEAEEGHAYSYQWYMNGAASAEGAVPIDGAVSSSLELPAQYEAGRKYVFCRVTASVEGSSRHPFTDSSFASFAVLPEKNTVNAELNVLFWGDGFASANGMGDIVKKLAASDGIKLNFTCASTYDQLSKGGRYNFYESCSFSGTTVTSVRNSAIRKAIEDPENNSYDYFIFMTSRDLGLTDSTSKTKFANAISYITGALSAAQPEMKFVLLAPSGYKNGSDDSLINVSSHNNFGSLTNHNPRIRAEANALLPCVSGECSAVYAGTAFVYFMNNYAGENIDLYGPGCIYPSMAGSYYTASVLYSSIFGKATYGSPFTGHLDADTAATLQEAADAYVSSTGRSLTAHGADFEERIPTVDELDPRKQPVKEGYENEVYPEHYDELLAAAAAYFQRGELVQYDNANMDKSNGTFYRRTLSCSSPEDATPQSLLYTDCSAFIYSLFVDAFGENFGGDNRTIPMFDNSHLGTCVFDWRYSTFAGTPEEASAAFYDALQPGDLILFVNEARSSDVGHIMLYLGNGMMIHSTGVHASGGGENYVYGEGMDAVEIYGGVLYGSVDDVGAPGGWLCQFETEDRCVRIFRPSSLGLTPTENALNRNENLRDAVAYKLTTAPRGVTVTPGEEVAFTFVINNLGPESKTVEISDTLSADLTYLSGDEAFTLSGSALSASVTVPAFGKLELSCTVKVNEGVGPGTVIDCHASYVGGVLLNNAPITVGRTLTAAQQAAVEDAAEAAADEASSGYELISGLYKNAFGATLPFASVEDMYFSAFTLTGGTKNGETFYYTDLLADRPFIPDNSFGGTTLRCRSGQVYRNKRLNSENLVAGDVLITADTLTAANGAPAVGGYKAYIYLGNGVLASVEGGDLLKYSKADTLTLLETLNSKAGFCVVRPSLGMQETLSVLFWGDSVIYDDTANIFAAFCREDGTPVTNIGGGATYDDTYLSTTYNIYECYSWEGSLGSYAVTGYSATSKSTSAGKFRAALDPNAPASDYCVVLISRDQALKGGTAEEKAKKAYLQTYENFKLQSPDGVFVLLVPPGFQTGCSSFSSLTGHSGLTRSTHYGLISGFASSVESFIRAEHPSADILTVDAGGAFEDFYSDRYPSSGIELYRDDLRSINEAGAYCIAAVLYATLSGKSPCGMEFEAYLTHEEAQALQEAAHVSVFGSAPTETTSHGPAAPSQTVFGGDARFMSQTFPANYDALLATALAYYERGYFVQYDQLAADRVNSSFVRRSLNLSPEAATSQTPLYLDCSSFVYSVLKTAFNYSLPESRSRGLTYNSISSTKLSVVYEEHVTDGTDVGAAISSFIGTLQPGDIIAYSDPGNSRGHVVLYLGSGYVIQCSSSSRLDAGSADYQYAEAKKFDAHEDAGAIRIDKIDFMLDPWRPTYQFDPADDMTIRIIRPVYSKLTPTAETVNRVNGLSGIVAWKETSAPEGVSVAPGGDVTFTVVVKNTGTGTKTLSVTDTLPSGVTLKSGSNIFSVTVAPGETVRRTYTVTVSAGVSPGTHKDYNGTKINGVSLNNTPIYVANTLSASGQTALVSAAEALGTASDAFAAAKTAYGAIGITLPFANAGEAIDALLVNDLSGSKPVNTLNTGSAYFGLLADGLFGGAGLNCGSSTYNAHRVKYLNHYNLVAGDILLCRGTDNSVYSYLFLGDAGFLTVKNGSVEIISGSAPCREILERAFGERAFCVLRPSLGN